MPFASFGIPFVKASVLSFTAHLSDHEKHTLRIDGLMINDYSMLKASLR